MQIINNGFFIQQQKTKQTCFEPWIVAESVGQATWSL